MNRDQWEIAYELDSLEEEALNVEAIAFGVLPHDTEAECIIVAYLMGKPDRYAEVAAEVGARAFYSFDLRKTFKEIGAQLDRLGEVSWASLLAALKKMQSINDATVYESLGGERGIDRLLISRPVDTAAFTWACETVAELAQRRALLTTAGRSYRDLIDGKTNSRDFMSTLNNAISDAQSRNIGVDPSDPKEVAHSGLSRVLGLIQGSATDIRTHIPPLDSIFDLCMGEYTIIAGESGSGKSTLAADICARLTHHHDCVISWHSCEIDPSIQMWRLVCSWFSSTYTDRKQWLAEDATKKPKRFMQRMGIKEQQSTFAKMKQGADWFANKPIHMHPSGSINVEDVRAATYKLRRQYPGKPIVVVVDYVQDATPDGRSNADEKSRINDASAMLRDIARELGDDGTVIALSQFTESNNRPDLSEGKGTPVPYAKRQIRGSKSIYHQADNVITVHRPFGDSLMVMQADKTRYGEQRHAFAEIDLVHKHARWWRDRVPNVEGLFTTRIHAPDERF